MFKIFLVVLWAVSVCLASEDSLMVFAYGQDANSVAPLSLKKSSAGIWNLKGKSKGSNKSEHRRVAVWFHGGMTSSNCSKGLVAGDDLAKMLPDFIVVSVSACLENHWVTPVAVGWVDAALDSVAARRGALVDEVYLVGISDGALGVLAYSIWGKRRVDSRVLMSSYGAAFGEASEVAAIPRLKTGRWRFIQGGADRLYPADVTVPWITRFCDEVGAVENGNLKAELGRCDLKFDPNGEHDWSYWKSRHKDWILEIFK